MTSIRDKLHDASSSTCVRAFKRELFRSDRIVTELRMICCRNGGGVCTVTTTRIYSEIDSDKQWRTCCSVLIKFTSETVGIHINQMLSKSELS